MLAVSARFLFVSHEDGAPAQAGFDGVQGGDGLACRRARAGGELGIGAISGEAALAEERSFRRYLRRGIGGQHAAIH